MNQSESFVTVHARTSTREALGQQMVAFPRLAVRAEALRLHFPPLRAIFKSGLFPFSYDWLCCAMDEGLMGWWLRGRSGMGAWLFVGNIYKVLGSLVGMIWWHVLGRWWSILKVSSVKVKKTACSVVYWGDIPTKSISNKQAERFSREVKYFLKIYIAFKEKRGWRTWITDKVTISTRIKGSKCKDCAIPTVCIFYTPFKFIVPSSDWDADVLYHIIYMLSLLLFYFVFVFILFCFFMLYASSTY